ncbi:hypothetical protein [Thermococcus sp. Bubb.Bath]|uniref:hypothetical protein n=1 Tax=Thermococcus sp. Bubb.Bath TaxID=1638242 RepID=UPI0014392D62|nr:hypothetical protein [Thermococcus sp. Bubb.Bath]NJF25084.1 hypothetical protein [Thermococcus sp. Bubb.Bath]
MKWKPLFAVLLGLLMVGVTAGSVSAQVSPTNLQISNVDSHTKIISLSTTNPYQFHPLPPKPKVFLDKDQVDLEFSKYDSYIQYGGRIYLAFHWGLDIIYVLNAGSPDRVSLLIPWEVKTPSGWVPLFEEDDPDVYVKVYIGDNSTIKITIEDHDGIHPIEKKIGNVEFRLKRVQVSAPENDVTSAEVYIGMTPRPEFINTTLPIVMGYTHTWDWSRFVTVITAVVAEGFVSVAFGPEAGMLAKIAFSALTSFTADELAGHLPKESWTIGKIFNVKLDYDEYLVHGGPSPSPCFNGRCAMYLNPSNSINPNNGRG